MTPHRNVRLLNLYAMFLSFLPFFPVAVVFYQHQLGLSFQQFLMVEAVFAATVVLMEVPSGWLADMWKRTYTLALSGAVTTLGFVTLGFADNIWLAILAEIIIGIGVSFSSGTISALLYDTVLESGEDEQYRKYEGKRHGYGFYSIGISCAIGGFLYEMNPFLPLIFSAATYAMCVPIALMMSEPARHKQVMKKNPFHDIGNVMHYALHKNREIAALIFFVAILYGSTQAGMWTQQPYFMELGIAERWFGVIISVGFLIGGLGSQLGHFLEKFMRPVKILVMLWALAIICWALSGAFLWYHALALLCISNIAWGIGFPVMQDAINRRVDSSRRATILSVASLMMRVVFIPVGFALGWISDLYGLQVGLLALAGFVLIANVWNVRRLIS